MNPNEIYVIQPNGLVPIEVRIIAVNNITGVVYWKQNCWFDPVKGLDTLKEWDERMKVRLK